MAEKQLQRRQTKQRNSNRLMLVPLTTFVLALATTTTTQVSAFAPSYINIINNINSNKPLFASSNAIQEGLIKTISKPGMGKPASLGDIATVKYTCYLPGDEKAVPFSRSQREKMVVGDGTMVPGWDKALRSMTVGERSIIRITDPSLGYGEAGVPPFIPPNAQLEFDIELLDSQPATANIDFDSLATADNTPRTASEIQAAYERRQALKALEGPKKEGLEGFIEKAKNFYFFGLFEGETGQQAPWFLRPSITFPLAFLVIGGAFYVSYSVGAISERGASVTDELDEIILSMSTTNAAAAAAAATIMSNGGGGNVEEFMALVTTAFNDIGM